MVHAQTARPPDPVWEAVEEYLLAAKRAVTKEIRNYPQPIAGCDAQIPALWEQRDGLVAELERLAAARESAAGETRQALDAFISASPYIDGETANALRNTLDRQPRSAAE